jgi:hypothetical protein
MVSWSPEPRASGFLKIEVGAFSRRIPDERSNAHRGSAFLNELVTTPLYRSESELIDDHMHYSHDLLLKIIVSRILRATLP